MSTYKNIDFEEINGEIGRKKIGEYLMKARMYPMYILMGSSMLGLSIGRGAMAKYLAPFMIFVMGLGFYMIYVSRQAEEKDERDKLDAQIKKKLTDEVSKRLKMISEYLEKTTDEIIMKFNNSIYNQVESYTQMSKSQSTDNHNSKVDYKTKSSMQKSYDDIKKLKSELKVLLTKIQ